MSDLVVPKIEVAEDSGTYVKVVAEPLEPGFGTTLGNGLRRVLLSSLPGAAVTAVRVDQVQHEFSTIPYMREDATEFLLNIKELRLKALADRPGRLYLDVAGERRVTAADIQAPPDYEIINPDLYLATLDASEARLTVEFHVESGRGWRAAGLGDGLPIGVIPVDAIFTPIRKVNYLVERSRMGQVTSYDRLVLEVWTDGSMTGVEAVHQAADILISQLSLFRQLGQPLVLRGERRLGSGVALDPQRYNTPIEALDLSVRAFNCLKRSGLMTVGQVLEMSEEELMSLRNFGRKSYDELKEKLVAMGFLPEAAIAAERPEGGVAEGGGEKELAPVAEGRGMAVEEPEPAEIDEGIDPRLRQLLRLRRQLEE